MKVFIPGPPGAKGRPRFTRSGRAYTPAKTLKYEGYLKSLMAEAMQDKPPLTGPVRVDLRFHMPEPKSMPKRDQGRHLPHVKRPDLDNLVKSVLDAANGVLVLDDSSVYAMTAAKQYSATPGVEIRLLQGPANWEWA